MKIEPSKGLPFCDTCSRSVTLEEIEANYHNGHRFDVAEAGALNLLRMFVYTRGLKSDEVARILVQRSAAAID